MATNKKQKTKNGFILDNDDIDINKHKYPNQDLINELNRRMGIYGYNVNLERAVPNVRDGLKPVQRVILYTGYNHGYRNNKPFRKSLKFIGAGSSYYVHGDASFYQTLMTMSQDFYTKYPLIEVHGNNGATTGDAPASARYTESRLSSYSEELIKDLSKDTVDWKDNYDNTEVQPTVLTNTYPNLLLNGSYGIGQGYLSSIPSHNFKDITERVIKIIKNPDISIDELVKDLLPDYPTGGVIINKKDLPNIYKTGSGTIRIRGKVVINDKDEVVIKSIPYMKNTGTILDRIQKAVKEEKITGISSIKDDTNATSGVNIRIIPKRGNDPRVIENQLYKYTPLQDSLTVQFICTTPDMLNFRYYNFKEMLEEWYKFRKVTLIRSFNSKLAVCKKKIHIDEGLLIALNPKNLDKIIKMIRNAKDKDEIKENLKKNYKMTSIQAEYIAELKLYQLSGMGIGSIEDDLEKQKAMLDEILGFLSSKKKIDNYIIDELEKGAKKFNTPRITEAIDVDLDNIAESTIDNTKHTIIITSEGFVKKIDQNKIKVQNKGGQGINIGKIKEGDYVINTLNCENLDELFFFTNQGRLLSLKVYDIKESNLNSYGILINTIINLKADEKVVQTIIINKDNYKEDGSFLLFATKNGLIKKTSLSLYSSVPKSGFCAIDLNKDDELIGVLSAKYDMDVIVATNLGNVIRYNTLSIPTTKRMTKGVKSITLSDKERVVSFDLFRNPNDNLLIVTSKGNGKRIEMKSILSTDRTKKVKPMLKLVGSEEVVSSFFVNDEDELTVVGTKKIVKIPVEQVPISLRVNPAKKIITLGRGEKVLLATK
jgi:DNA gyrase subunit A